MNIVECNADRFNLSTKRFTGSGDAAEAAIFKRVVLQKGLCENEQYIHTYRHGIDCTSKLDRCYTSTPAAWAHTKELFCDPLEDKTLSDHRPLRFGMRSIPSSRIQNNLMRGWVVNDESFLPRVAAAYGANGDIERASPWFRLAALKTAFRTAETQIIHDSECRAVRKEDVLPVLVAAAKAVERGELDRLEGLSRKCESLAEVSRKMRAGQGRSARTMLDALLTKATAEDLLAEADRLARDAEEAEAEKRPAPSYAGIEKRLKKLIPGGASGVHTLMVGGELITDKARIDSELNSYWGKVFQAQPIEDRDKLVLQSWLDDHLRQMIPPECFEAKPNFRKVIAHIRNTAPGPDGIPYAAYKKCLDLCLPIFVDAWGWLWEGSGAIPQDFNHATMACLPPKASGTDPALEDFYAPENTRPLSIVNTDNRIIAAAMKRGLEKSADDWVSQAQQGFIPGRSMASNILQVELEGRRRAKVGKKGAIVLFDFAAAFPSVDQGFLLTVLEAVGVRGGWKRMVEALYIENRQFIGEESFLATTGIRQGCHLSPLLFAIVADVLLRKIADDFPEGAVRAFADDTAMIIDDVADLSRVLDLFAQYGAFSNLKLNLKKTVVIPLYSSNLNAERLVQSQRDPRIGELKWEYAAKYLGVYVGPEAEGVAWDEALAKFSLRSKRWSQLGLGAVLGVKMYNTFVQSVLSFLCQFFHPPDKVLTEESSAVRRLLPGPRGWCKVQEILHLKDWHHFPMQPHSLATTSLAAKVRLYYTEEWFKTNPRPLDELASVAGSDDIVLDPFVLRWVRGGILKQILEAVDRAKAAGIAPLKRPTEQKEKRAVQREIVQKWNALEAKDVHLVDRKLARWRFSLQSNVQDARFELVSKKAAKLVPPRVKNAHLSVLWNRTSTSMRAHQRADLCILCQRPHSRDEVEHWPYCKVVRGWAGSVLDLDIAMFSPGEGRHPLRTMLCMGSDVADDYLLTRRLFLLYLTYTAHNELRHRSRIELGDEKQARDWAVWALALAVRGHSNGSRVLKRLGSCGRIVEVEEKKQRTRKRRSDRTAVADEERALTRMRPRSAGAIANPLPAAANIVSGGFLSRNEVFS